MRKISKVLLILIICLLAVEAACFLLIRPERGVIREKAELLVVIKGPDAPTRTVFDLLAKGVAARFTIPGTPTKSIESFTKKYGLPSDVTYIPTVDKTESTFEDVLQASKVIRSGGFKDVLLVAAEFHVARSNLLLRAETLGTGCRIRLVGIGGKWTIREKITHWYGEVIKLPGSFIELAWYHLTGGLLTQQPQLNAFFEMLKKIVLAE